MKKIGVILIFSMMILAGALCFSGGSGNMAFAGDASTVPGGSEKIVVGVMPFGTEAKETKDNEPPETTAAREQIARDALVQSLARSFSVASLKAEVIDNIVGELGIVSPKDASERDAVEIGRRADAQYIILGRVTKISQRNDVREKKQLFSKSHETSVTASAQLQVKVVDVSSGRVVMNLPGYGVGRSTHTTKSAAGFIGVGSLLVLRHDQILGYSDFSLPLASAVVNCQSTVFWSALRDFSQADISLFSLCKSGIRLFRHCFVIADSSISATFNQLPCFGV